MAECNRTGLLPFYEGGDEEKFMLAYGLCPTFVNGRLLGHWFAANKTLLGLLPNQQNCTYAVSTTYWCRLLLPGVPYLMHKGAW